MPAKNASSFFYFTRKDRRGALVLICLIFIICLIPFIYPFFAKEEVAFTSSVDAPLLRLQAKTPVKYDRKDRRKQEEAYQPYDHPSSAGYTSYKRSFTGTLFSFDPNTISAEDWKRLGLRDKTIATILNFRSKGGKFRKPEDIKKIWGLFPDEAERLLPYVQIAETSSAYEQRPPSYSSKPKPAYAIVDINAADSTAFVSLPGIGSKLSQRIINFRNRLGGFYDVEQVKETFGLPDSVFQTIKPMLQLDGEVKKININTATLEELKMHPYIKYHLANALVQYRQQHGLYQSVEGIRKIMIVTDEQFQKLKPYLTIE